MKTTFSKMVWSIAALLLSSLVRADVTATVTMSDSTFLNLTTGSTSINGADIGYKSTIGIFYQGSAKGLNLGQIGASSYAALTQAALAQLSAAEREQLRAKGIPFVVFDPTTSRASAVSITVVLTLNLRERATGRLLYSRAGWAVRERYQIASDPHQFIDESGPAVDRLGRDVAADIVSAVVENF